MLAGDVGNDDGNVKCSDKTTSQGIVQSPIEVKDGGSPATSPVTTSNPYAYLSTYLTDNQVHGKCRSLFAFCLS